jgi:hypothetical protein
MSGFDPDRRKLRKGVGALGAAALLQTVGTLPKRKSSQVGVMA